MIYADGRRVKLDGYEGRYEVRVMRNAVEYDVAGEVAYWETRYNLRRVIVSRGWRARYKPEGDGPYECVGYRENGCTAGTRKAAVVKLLQARGYSVTET